MKFKLKSKAELSTLTDIFKQLFHEAMHRAQSASMDNVLTQSDIINRLIALEMLEVLKAGYKAEMKNVKTPTVSFSAQSGLALLSAWYSTDATSLEISPLGNALMSDLTDALTSAYCGTIIK